MIALHKSAARSAAVAAVAVVAWVGTATAQGPPLGESAKARLAWLFGTAYRSLVSSAPQPRTSSFERQEPSLSGRAAPSLAPQEEDYEGEEEEQEDDEEEEAE